MKLLLKNLLFAVLVPGTVGIYLPLWIAGSRGVTPGPRAILGAALLAAGAAILAWCIWDFGRFGRGTPAPIDAPTKLVVRGLYRYSRNPMYVGVAAMILGWAGLLRAPELLLYALVVVTAFQLFVVLYEEPHLRRLFGAEYDAYCSRVGRWLLR